MDFARDLAGRLGLNASHGIHLLFSIGCELIAQLVIGSNPGTGALFAAAYLTGREVMDRQRQIVAEHKRAGEALHVVDLPVWSGLDVWNWSPDSKRDAGIGWAFFLLVRLLW